MANNAPLSEAAQEFMRATTVFIQDFEVFSRDYSEMPRRRRNALKVTNFDKALEKLEESSDQAMNASEALSAEDHDHPRVRRRNAIMSRKWDALHAILERWLERANAIGVREQLGNRHRYAER